MWSIYKLSPYSFKVNFDDKLETVGMFSIGERTSDSRQLTLVSILEYLFEGGCGQYIIP